jgi:murein DD-endopeptidase MepM/ murein hydrolase activator NlpD
VTALPYNLTEIDRIIDNSMEIRHEDGTIAVYLGLNPEFKELKLGQVVFPGEPIGIIGSSKLLTFRVFEIQDEGR